MSTPETTLSPDILRSTALTTSAAAARARVRLHSIDAVRGFVIVVMALDHVRAYFSDVRFDPLDLTQTTSALFLTRWITHLCAPTFVFLAGVSACLMARRMDVPGVRRFLLTRGLWLLLLEFTVVQFGWSFNLRYDNGLFLQVIWAIGASMIVLAGVVHWPRRVIGALALLMIAGHHVFDGIAPAQFGALAPLWNLLHVKGQTPFALVLYPLVPWIGVMALGYCAGGLFELEPAARRRLLTSAGVGALMLFVVLRLINAYGDPHPWSPQASPMLTLLSFIDVSKYPPSLDYVLVTLGIAALLLAAFEAIPGRMLEAFRTFGRVPLFIYVLHIYLAHFAAGVIAYSMGYTEVIGNFFKTYAAGWGFGLPGVYAAWFLVILALYPACRWFAGVKERRREWWLAYL